MLCFSVSISSFNHIPGIAQLCTFSLLLHSDSKMHMCLSIISFFTLNGTWNRGNVEKKEHRHMKVWLFLIYYMSIHWGQVSHICIGKLTGIGSDNDLSPGWCQAIVWTNSGILLIWHQGTNFNEMLIEIHKFWLKTTHLKMSSAKWRPFCPGLNVLSHWLSLILPVPVK